MKMASRVAGKSPPGAGWAGAAVVDAADVPSVDGDSTGERRRSPRKGVSPLRWADTEFVCCARAEEATIPMGMPRISAVGELLRVLG